MKFIKYGIAVIIVVLIVVLYNTSTFTTWRLYNNGVKKYKEKKYDESSKAFRKASKISNDPIHFYNLIISESKILEKSIKQLKRDDTIQEFNYSYEFNQLESQISLYQTSLDSLLIVKYLPDSLNPKIYHLKGKFYLLTKDTLNAINNFLNAVSNKNDFQPSLLELVKLKKNNETDLIDDSLRRLILNISDVEEIGIVKNYKPF